MRRCGGASEYPENGEWIGCGKQIGDHCLLKLRTGGGRQDGHKSHLHLSDFRGTGKEDQQG